MCDCEVNRVIFNRSYKCLGARWQTGCSFSLSSSFCRRVFRPPSARRENSTTAERARSRISRGYFSDQWAGPFFGAERNDRGHPTANPARIGMYDDQGSRARDPSFAWLWQLISSAASARIVRRSPNKVPFLPLSGEAEGETGGSIPWTWNGKVVWIERAGWRGWSPRPGFLTYLDFSPSLSLTTNNHHLAGKGPSLQGPRTI